MSKYNVKACPNCKFKKKTADGFICTNPEPNQQTLDSWYYSYGKLPQREWVSYQDLSCYQPDKRSLERETNQASLSDFMSDLSDLMK